MKGGYLPYPYKGKQDGSWQMYWQYLIKEITEGHPITLIENDIQSEKILTYENPERLINYIFLRRAELGLPSLENNTRAKQ